MVFCCYLFLRSRLGLQARARRGVRVKLFPRFTAAIRGFHRNAPRSIHFIHPSTHPPIHPSTTLATFPRGIASTKLIAPAQLSCIPPFPDDLSPWPLAGNDWQPWRWVEGERGAFSRSTPALLMRLCCPLVSETQQPIRAGAHLTSRDALRRGEGPTRCSPLSSALHWPDWQSEEDGARGGQGMREPQYHSSNLQMPCHLARSVVR